jgi:transcriptional regulator with XRE-family HTH domain
MTELDDMRIAAGMSVKELARATQIPRETVRQACKGELPITPARAMKFAEVLGQHADRFKCCGCGRSLQLGAHSTSEINSMALQTCRQNAGLSQEALADLVHCSQSYIGILEKPPRRQCNSGPPVLWARIADKLRIPRSTFACWQCSRPLEDK